MNTYADVKSALKAAKQANTLEELFGLLKNTSARVKDTADAVAY